MCKTEKSGSRFFVLTLHNKIPNQAHITVAVNMNTANTVMRKNISPTMLQFPRQHTDSKVVVTMAFQSIHLTLRGFVSAGTNRGIISV